MKIKRRSEVEKVEFFTLAPGDLFKDGGNVWMVIEPRMDCNVVCPNTGEVEEYEGKRLVTPCPNAVLLVDGE